MAAQLLVDIEQMLRELCAERAIAVESVRFFGSRTRGTTSDESDVDVVVVSSAFEEKDIFQRAAMTKGIHRALVKRFKVPFDIVFCSVTEWTLGGSPLLHEIKRVA